MAPADASQFQSRFFPAFIQVAPPLASAPVSGSTDLRHRSFCQGQICARLKQRRSCKDLIQPTNRFPANVYQAPSSGLADLGRCRLRLPKGRGLRSRSLTARLRMAQCGPSQFGLESCSSAQRSLRSRLLDIFYWCTFPACALLGPLYRAPFPRI